MKTYKRLLCLCLSIFLLVSLCACEKKEKTEDPTEATKPSQTETTTQPTTASEPETTAPTEPPTEAKKEQPENTLMKSTAVFGNAEIARADITMITFLDTLQDVPDNAWDASKEGNGCVMAWTTEEDGLHLYIAGERGVYAPSDSSDLFERYESVEEIQFNGNFDTSYVTDMNHMFTHCFKLARIDMSDFDTSNVTDMGVMFGLCENMTEIDLSNFDTSKVENMYGMFRRCYKLKHANLSNFDTSNVTVMREMFFRCYDLESIELSNFNTERVENFEDMFYRCLELKNLDLSSFNFESAKNLKGMFCDTEKLTSIGCTITPPEGAETDGMYEDSALQP